MATRRSLHSASNAAGTALHSTADITLGSQYTVGAWVKRHGVNEGKTLFASDTGQDQIFTDINGTTRARYGNSGAGVDVGPAMTDETWVHVNVQFGLDISGTNDVIIQVNGGTATLFNTATATSESASAGTIAILGDDFTGTETDGGFAAHIFDFCVVSGLHTPAEMNYDAGEWKELDATPLAALILRLDGQNTGDAGEDSSGNANHFTVENGGVVIDATDLPPGANPSTEDALLANDVESASEVSAPAIGQAHALLAEDVESASEAASPSLGGAHVLAADDAEAASEVSAPVPGQAHALLADDPESAAEVTAPVLGEIEAGDLFLRPASTIAAGGWLTHLGGADLHTAIDEAVADDGDYIRSNDAPSSDKATIKLDQGSVDTAKDVRVRYRYKKEGSATINLVVGVESPAGTLRASATHNGISASFVDGTLALSGAEAASVDWNDAHLAFTKTQA